MKRLKIYLQNETKRKIMRVFVNLQVNFLTFIA